MVEDAMVDVAIHDMAVVVEVFKVIRGEICPTIVGHMARVLILVGGMRTL